MSKFVYIGASIECMASDVISRTIVRSSFMEITSIGKCTTYKCKRNSEAHITKELPRPKDGSKWVGVKSINSKLNLKDCIECEDLLLAVADKKTLKPSIINFTGRHKAQSVSTKCYTYATVTLPFPNIPVRQISNSSSQNLLK